MVKRVEGTLDEAKLQLEELGVDPVVVTTEIDGTDAFGEFRADKDGTDIVVRLTDAELERLLGFFLGVLRRLKVEGRLGVEIADETITVRIWGSELGVLIGHHGQTLNALQHILNIVAARQGFRTDRRLILDIEDYRARREEYLEDLALKMAQKADAMQEPVVLRPLPPSERRIIHKVLQDDERVETMSEGEEPHRKVMIVPSGRVSEISEAETAE